MAVLRHKPSPIAIAVILAGCGAYVAEYACGYLYKSRKVCNFVL